MNRCPEKKTEIAYDVFEMQRISVFQTLEKSRTIVMNLLDEGYDLWMENPEGCADGYCLEEFMEIHVKEKGYQCELLSEKGEDYSNSVF